jgi:hypothetical protein
MVDMTSPGGKRQDASRRADSSVLHGDQISGVIWFAGPSGVVRTIVGAALTQRRAGQRAGLDPERRLEDERRRLPGRTLS